MSHSKHTHRAHCITGDLLKEVFCWSTNYSENLVELVNICVCECTIVPVCVLGRGTYDLFLGRALVQLAALPLCTQQTRYPLPCHNASN